VDGRSGTRLGPFNIWLFNEMPLHSKEVLCCIQFFLCQASSVSGFNVPLNDGAVFFCVRRVSLEAALELFEAPNRDLPSAWEP